MKPYRSLSAVIISAFILTSCGLKNISETAADIKNGVESAAGKIMEIGSDIENAYANTEYTYESRYNEDGESVIHYDEGEAEVHIYGTAPKHFALTEKYFEAEKKETQSTDYRRYNGAGYELYEDHAVCTNPVYSDDNNNEIVEIASEISGLPVTEIAENAFSGSKVLKKIVLPDSIEKVGKRAFADCPVLEEAVIHGDIGEYAFENCENLKKVTAYGNIGERAFLSCDNLTDFTMLSGTRIEQEAFYNDSKIKGCQSLINVTLPDELEFIGKYAFNSTPFHFALKGSPEEYVMLGKVLYSYNGNKDAESISIPEDAVMIGDLCFSSMNNITEFVIPEGIKYIGYQAVACCSKLEKVSMPSTLIWLGDGVFCDDHILNNVVLPENLEHLGGYCFENCHALDSITFNEKLSYIGRRPFDFTKWQENNYGLTIINGILVRCNSYHHEYTVPEGVVAISDMAFYRTLEWCCVADKVTLPDSIEYIGKSAFKEAWLDEINFPKNLKVIEEEAFYTNFFSEAIIPNGTMEIGKGAFETCSFLKKAVIPDGITELPEHIFWECYSLEELTIPDSVETFGSGCVYNDNAVTIKCSRDSCADHYFSASPKIYN
ncbi:MAG: leucine-rich repeat domain-containing protein [Oscillospiraceae bacterium]